MKPINIMNKLNESDGRYYVLRKLEKALRKIEDIDYGDIEGTERYGDMGPGLKDQERISNEIKQIVQDYNITKEEFDEVAEPLKHGFDISYSYFAHLPKHASNEDLEKNYGVDKRALHESYDAWNVIEDVQSDLENLIKNLESQASNDIEKDVVIKELKSILNKLENNSKDAW